MSGPTFELKGMDEVNDNLALLTTELRDRAVKKVMKKITTSIRDSARSRVRRDTGTLHNAIQDKVTSKGAKGAITIGIVGIRRGIKVPIRVVSRGRNKGKVLVAIPTRYAHLVERGHRIVTSAIWERDPKSKHGRLREIRGSGAGTVVGYAPARPFMRPAWDTYGGEKALRVFIVDLDKEVRDVVSRMRRTSRRP